MTFLDNFTWFCGYHTVDSGHSSRWSGSKITPIWLSILILVLSSSLSSARDKPTFADLTVALTERNWSSADSIAKSLDHSFQHGDLFAAYTASLHFASLGNCQKSIALSGFVVKSLPQFFPATDLLAKCLINAGEREKASAVYEEFAANEPQGAIKTIALDRAERLRPNLSPQFGLQFTGRTSNNIKRQTSASTFAGGTISQKSKAKPGAAFTASAVVTKPIYRKDRFLSALSLSLGNHFDSTEKFHFRPEVGISSQNKFILNPNAILHIEPFVKKAWDEGEVYLSSYGVNGAVYSQINKSRTISFNASASMLDYDADYRDGSRLSTQIRLTEQFRPQDRAAVILGTQFTRTQEKSISYDEVYVDVEWDHMFKNQLIVSIGARAGYRKYFGNAPLSHEKQVDKYSSLRLGISHNNVRYKNWRPEAFIEFTRQKSNNVFYQHDFTDIGVRLKTHF